VAPAAEVLDAGQRRLAHSALQAGIVGQALHAVGQRVHVANGNDETLGSVAKQIFAASVRSCQHGAAAGERLALDERQPLFDGRQHQNVTFAHQPGQLHLGDGAEELDVLLREARQELLDLRGDISDDAQALGWVPELLECLQQVGHSFAQRHVPGEEHLEGVRGRVCDLGEGFEADSVGNGVDLLRGHAQLKER
jgi:hypothetical protein